MFDCEIPEGEFIIAYGSYLHDPSARDVDIIYVGEDHRDTVSQLRENTGKRVDCVHLPRKAFERAVRHREYAIGSHLSWQHRVLGDMETFRESMGIEKAPYKDCHHLNAWVANTNLEAAKRCYNSENYLGAAIDFTQFKGGAEHARRLLDEETATFHQLLHEGIISEEYELQKRIKAGEDVRAELRERIAEAEPISPGTSSSC